MEHSSILISLSLILPLIIFLLITKTKKSPKNLPPGSFGIPIIGQSLDLLRAMRANKGEDWLQDRVRKHGPISRLNLFGTPTVFLHGHAANKFIYTCSEKILANQQPSSIRRLCGERSIMELNGEDHKRVRGALMSFLKPEARDTLVKLFEHLVEGALAVPINLPFTRFNKSLHARSKIRDIILELIQEKKQQLKQNQDLISTLLNMRDVTNSPILSDEEIVDNTIVAMIAGHDTTSILLTFLIKLLAENSEVYKNVLYEQEEIARGKTSSNELLTWEDLGKMKYTWRMATESMRINPPVFCSFRKVIWAGCMTHMDESIYPDPSRFDPSRFENQGGTPPYSFVAFGGGPRMCPGYEFARIETLTLIHYLVTGFQWKLSLQDNFFGRDPMPVFKHGLPIRIELKK
ncbi:hypothetical protein ACJIZ3_006596 [Penstemon smallii]|uniref:Cytochrome P450 n=1 Tax=Penstemon smallii TaxID=265156 RepID=A0ABD3S8D5_9LAMI